MFQGKELNPKQKMSILDEFTESEQPRNEFGSRKKSPEIQELLSLIRQSGKTESVPPMDQRPTGRRTHSKNSEPYEFDCQCQCKCECKCECAPSECYDYC